MPDTQTLAVVADCSGSMRELGKSMLVRNLLAYVRECERLRDRSRPLGQLRVICWGTEASELELGQQEELRSFAVSGRAKMEPLLALLEEIAPGNAKLRLLLFSDGHLASSDAVAFMVWRRKKPGVSVRAIAVGPDAVRAAMTKMADRNGVFLPEDIASALTPWPLHGESASPMVLAEVTGEAG